MQGIRALECSGAEVIGISANTPHIIFDDLQRETKVKMVSIIDSVAKEAKKKGFKKLLLLGTKTTMTFGFYAQGLKRHGLDVIVPQPDEIESVNRIIFEELTFGDFKSKDHLIKIVNKYSGKVDAVILGCTELPLAFKEKIINIPLLDSAKIHVVALIEEALKP